MGCSLLFETAILIPDLLTKRKKAAASPKADGG